MARLKVGVLISGRGSNLQALLDASADASFPAEIALVVANVAEAYGLERARKAGVPTLVLKHRDFPDRETFDSAIDSVMRDQGIGLICLAGFMRLLSPGFASAWQGRLMNIHPALLPSFKGLHTHRQALAAGVKLHGCSVHFVTPDLDDGPLIVQAAVPVLETDDEDSLAARVLEQEHRIYPLAVRLFAENRLAIEGRRVRIDGAEQAASALVNPSPRDRMP